MYDRYEPTAYGERVDGILDLPPVITDALADQQDECAQDRRQRIENACHEGLIRGFW